jgi:hypothetical protein
VLASTVDFVPTILNLAGLPLPSDRIFDGKDLGPVIFAKDPELLGVDAHHLVLFISCNGKAYPDSVKNWNNHNNNKQKQKPGGNGNRDRNRDPTGLFEKIRMPGLSAMYKVGYNAQCCRGASGDANTPYNDTCSDKEHGALAPNPTWLDVPLLFNLTVDVAESTPLRFGTAEHLSAWKMVNASMNAMLVSLESDKISVVTDHKGDRLCCNSTNVVCRCEEE